ncbi:protein CHUP1, chloroplastic-like [Zingiber officinale]|uniref:protein CHUP1, chloroplastic-like n=1 Tax=Zingiber officinale TaxID=94328 RepID=UPI001C4C984B|nr:protein CHUP1, chloroplastic-like [Zingiber officinale]
MVAGKVKAAMGFQRSPAAAPKAESARWTSSASVSHKSSPGSAGQRAPPTPLPSSNPKTAAAFARSFGVYFPRASAQVQPRPPDVAELLRVVEELQETESRLRAQLMEQKILRETVAVVPSLEKEIAQKDDELARAGELIRRLEVEKRALRDEVEGLSSMIRSGEEEGRRREKMIADLEATLEELRKKTVLEHGIRESRPVVEGEEDGCSSAQRLQGLIDASVRSNLLKNLRKGPKSADIAGHDQDAQKSASGDETKAEGVHQERRCCEKEEVFNPRVPRVPKPPPTRTITCNSSISSPAPSSCSSSETTQIISTSKAPKLAALPPIPPPTPPAGPSPHTGVRPPPPPPPPPKRGSRSAAASVRRVPEVVEFYHSLMRRDSKKESSGGGQEVVSIIAASNPRDMIGEIENRSSHLLAIKTDVETQGDFIKLLIKEVEHAVFANIEDVVAFVKWLDDELSFLVDERAVLKHFNWPEHKVDAMREAAFGYCDLKKLESEASSFQDDPRQLCAPSSLKKMKALLEKLEQGVYNLSRLQENATHRYKRFGVPCEWMQENGCVSQIKLASVKLAMKYMKRVSTELQVIAGSLEEEELMLQGVRFAFRVHQFAGGFDAETMRAFQELKDKARVLLLQSQSQNQQKLYAGLQIGKFAAKQPIL